MKALTGLLFDHWPLKLLALLLATVLYVGLTLSESTRSFTGPVAVEVLNPPVGGALLDDPGVVDRIEFRAPDDIAATISNDSFRASVDLSNVEPRSGAEPVEVPIDVFPVDPRVRVVDYSPNGTTVRVDEVVSRTLPVQIDSGPLPEGIDLGPVTIDPNQATVTGASTRIQEVRSVEGRFVVDSSGINIDEDVTVQAFDDLGALVPGVDVEPSTVRASADVARQLSYATVPVVPTIVGEPAAGMRIGTVSVVPSAVTVAGENPDVNRLEVIATEPLDLAGADSERVADLGLVLPDDTTTPATDRVRVIVTIVAAQGSRAFEAATAIVDAAPGRRYRVADPSVRVLVAGPLELLDELEATDLVAELPAFGLDLGDNDVMPVVDLPRGTSLVRLTPATVRVTVTDTP
jgi:YbbR domain-containing protein